MNPAVLEKHLAQAEKHVALGEHLIRQQRARVAHAKSAGLDTSTSQKLLRTFEQTQALHETDLRRLRALLKVSEKLDSSSPATIVPTEAGVSGTQLA